jgi:uncharacterized GH25 family protein
LAALAPPGTVLGWVSDQRGLPIPNAKVTLVFEDKEKEESVPHSELAEDSTTNGTFEFSEVPPGRWTLKAERKGYASSVVTGLEVTAETMMPPVDLRLSEELILKGTVRATSPVPGARVEAFREVVTVHDGGSIFNVRVTYSSTSTDDKGAFELGQLPPGPVRLQVQADGFARVERTVDMTTDIKPIEVLLASEALISGFVRDERGVPVEQAQIELRLPGDPVKKAPYAATVSDARGAFSFNGLPGARAFDLYARAKRYASVGPLTVISGTSTNTVILTTGGAVEGSVVNFDTQSPMPGLRVRAQLEEEDRSVVLTTRTNSEGRYRLRWLPAGNYTVSVVDEQLTADPRGGLKVVANQITRDINFSVYPGLTIEGDVIDGDTGERLVNATIEGDGRVGPSYGVNRKISASTDEAGLFRITNLPIGIYTIRARLNGYTAGVGQEAAARVELLRERLHPPVRINLYKAGTIEGLVTDQGGGGVANALVQIRHPGSTPGRIHQVERFHATTTPSGRFTIEGLPLTDEVHLEASAWAPGQAKAKSDLIVLNRAEPIVWTTINIGGGQLLKVQVSSAQGVPISKARVSLDHTAFSDNAPPAWSGETDIGGFIDFRQVTPGRINVHVSAEGFLAASQSIQLTTERPGELTFQLAPATTLAGRVVDDRLEPIREGHVAAHALPGSTGGGSAGIGTDSTFLIKGLGKGAFLVETRAIRKTSTGNRQVFWALPRVTPTAGFGELVITVPMSGILRGFVDQPDGDVQSPRYTVEINGSYVDDAKRSRSINVRHEFPAGSEFIFDSLPPGEYRLNAWAPNYLPVTAGPFRVESPGVAFTERLVLRPGGSFKARVIHRETGEPISQALVALKPDGPAGRTNNAGEVSFSPITPGIYTAEISHGEFLPASEALIHIVRGKQTDIGEVALDPGAMLSGTVKDGQGNALRGIRVQTSAVDRKDVRAVSTDASGRYLLRGLRPGGQLVTISGRVKNRPISVSENLTVTANQPTVRDVVLRADSTLRGWLSAPSTVDVARAVVTLYPLNVNDVPNTAVAIRTDERSGSTFRFDNLVEGRYLATVQAPRLRTTHFWSSTVLVQGADTRMTIESGINTLQGRILDGPLGLPVARQQVRLDYRSSPESGINALRNWWQRVATTDAEGFFEFTLLPGGVHSLTANNARFENDILEVLTFSPAQPMTLIELDFATPRAPGPRGAGN